MNGHSGGKNGGETRWARNRAHWDATLDPRNLRSQVPASALQRELALYETVDVRRAIDLLGPLDGRLVLDLGGGLGLMAILLARRGADVVVADVSPRRLAEARRRAREAGVEHRVRLVVAGAEALPFRRRSFDRATTKSVLIHTELRVASAELARVLARDGVAVLVEPLARHPLVNLYRRLAAPAIWGAITTYFTPGEVRTVRLAARRKGFSSRLEVAVLLGFLATPLNYTLGWPRLFRLVEACFDVLDRLLLGMAPGLRRHAWFVLIRIGGRQ